MSKGFTFKSNRKNVDKQMSDNQNSMLTALGAYVQGEAKMRSPVGQYDDGRVGGRLRDSIEYKTDNSQKRVDVGTNVNYALFVEKGTYKMTAQPFLTPSFEENFGNLENIAKSYMTFKD